jgi:hypothetical protein
MNPSKAAQPRFANQTPWRNQGEANLQQEDLDLLL